jgi:hypothetical protein
MRQIQPDSLRAQMDLRRLGDRFFDAARNLSRLGKVCLREIGLDWNPIVLEVSRGGRVIVYTLDSEYAQLGIQGRVCNVGRDRIGIGLDSGVIGPRGMYRDEVVRSLSEALDYVSKLGVQEEGGGLR